MFKSLFLLLFWLSSMLMAAYPKPYAKLGDPIYRDLAAVKVLDQKLSFGSDDELIADFVKQGTYAKREGYALVKLKGTQEGARRAKVYILTLRQLERQNREIALIIKRKLRYTIKKGHKKSFATIIASKHSVLHSDRKLKAEIARYQKRLKKERSVARKQHKNHLRSAANLTGKWHNTPHKTALWVFNAEKLTITNDTPQMHQFLKGEWRIDGKHLIHTVYSVTNQRKNRMPHSRQTKATQYYTIISISSKMIKLKDIYGDTLVLRRQK